MYKKVEGHSDLIRDMDSGAIINNDTTAYQNYINLRNEKIKEKEKVERLESEIYEIKMILKELVNKL